MSDSSGNDQADDKRHYVKDLAARCGVRFFRIVQELKQFDGLITAIATVLLAIVTVLLAFIAYWQYQELHRADVTARTAQRPYIGVTGLRISTTELPLLWTFRVNVENSGGTPPLNMRYLVIASPEVPTDPDDRFKKPRDYDSIFNGTLAPKASGPLVFGFHGVPATFFESRNYYYVYGVIRYRDRYEGTPEHVTKFCYAAISIRGPDVTGLRPGYDMCRFWNCTDEDCERDRKDYDAELLKLKSSPPKQ